MKQVVWYDASNPAYFFQLGIFALKNGQYDEGLDALAAVFRTPYLTAQLRRLSHYYLGRAYAHLRKRQEALKHTAPRCWMTMRRTPSYGRRRDGRARRVKIFGRYRLKHRSLCIMMQQSDMLYY